MASKRKCVVANGEEYSEAQSGKQIKKSTLAQHARREREQILKQSTVVSGKENTQPQVGKEISKSSMGQRARREREQILKQSTIVSGKENTQPQVDKEISKSSKGQRARRERERILKQSTALQTEQHLLRDTRAQPLQEINVGVPLDERCANIVNNDTRMADTIAQTRQKSSYADKGKWLLTYAKEKETSLVEPLRERNVGVAIHEEQNVNVMCIREVPNGSIIATKSLAQRARRERERNLNQGHSYPSRQRSQLGRTNERLQPIPQADPPSLTPIRRPLNCFGQGSIETQSIQKRQRVAQTSTSLPFMPSTSSTKHTNRYASFWMNCRYNIKMVVKDSTSSMELLVKDTKAEFILQCVPSYLKKLMLQDNGVQMLKDYISQFYDCPYVFIIPAPKIGCLDHCAPVVTFVLKVDWSEECWHIFKGKSMTDKETTGSS